MKDVADFGWAASPLGDLVDILDRLRKPITKRDRKAGPYPYYGATGILDHVDGYLFDEPLVLIGEDGAKWEPGANSAFAIDGKTWVNNHAHVIRPLREKVLDGWLIYYLNGADLMPFISGMTVPKLNQGRLREIPIPLPPLEEQQRIVAVLDEAFEGLARARVHAEANLQNARALIEAGLGTAFNPVTAKLNGWDLSDLSSMAKLSYGYTTKANSEPNGPKFLRITDIQDGTVDWDNVPFCSTPPDDYERYRVKSGDILFARTGATTGKSYLMTDEIEAVAASYLIRLRLASMALKPEYLALFFQSDVYWETIRAGISGSTQGGFNASKLGELVVPVPPLAIQDVVISRLEEIQDQAARLTSTYFVKLQDLDDLRQSLLQKAFAGELT